MVSQESLLSCLPWPRSKLDEKVAPLAPHPWDWSEGRASFQRPGALSQNRSVFLCRFYFDCSWVDLEDPNTPGPQLPIEASRPAAAHRLTTPLHCPLLFTASCSCCNVPARPQDPLCSQTASAQTPPAGELPHHPVPTPQNVTGKVPLPLYHKPGPHSQEDLFSSLRRKLCRERRDQLLAGAES